MSLHRTPFTCHTHSLSFQLPSFLPSFFLLSSFRILCIPYNLNSRWRSLPLPPPCLRGIPCVYLFNDELITQTFAAMFISVCKYARRDREERGSVPVISMKPYDWDRYHGPFSPFSPILHLAIYTHARTRGRSVCQLHAYITPRTHHLPLSLFLSLSLSLCRVNFTRELNYSPRLRTRSIMLSRDTLFVSWGGGDDALYRREYLSFKSVEG